ncbi:MAG: 50S ribosomal protein L6 [DPANN group archaeon]|nr:50S ribosomal protein L6 [DPANN group archaeon]
MNVKHMEEILEIPEGIKAEIAKNHVQMTGKRGTVTKDFKDPHIQLAVSDGRIVISAENATKREKRQLFTIKAHLKNLFKGAAEGHVYRLKICSGHFPMNVNFQNNELVVKNYLGEKVPRKLPIDPDVKVDVKGEVVELEGVSKEKVGKAASSIELLTRRVGFDRRIFQDGIYIIHKDGKDI